MSSPVLPPGYSARSPTLDERDAAHDVIVADHLAEFGEVDYSRDDMVEEWGELEPTRDTWVLVAPGGAFAGYAKLNPRKRTWLESTACVHPEHLGRGLGGALVDLIEHRAHELVREGPDARVTLANIINGRNPHARALLEGRGYAFARRFFRMVRDLDGPLPEPGMPPGFTLRAFRPGQDDRALYEAHESSFAENWGHAPVPFETWVQDLKSPRFDPSLCLIAESEGQVAGFARAMVFSEHEGWLRVLGVPKPWRRRGLALALLQHVFAAFQQRGLRRVLLGVDTASPDDALGLYERAGMRPLRIIDVFEKTLAQG